MIYTNGQLLDKKRFISLPSNSTPERIRKKLTHAIKLIPLVNKKKQLVDIASHYRFRLLPLYEPYIKGNEQKYVNDAINSVAESQNKASQITKDYELGKETDLTKVIMQQQISNIAFQMTLNVRNKVLSSYKDIMNMPV